MEELSMCRICLIKDVRLHCLVNTNLQEIYELLSGNLLETKDTRPLHACYMCCARLRKCLRLRIACLHSEELFSNLLENDLCEVTPSKDMSMLQRVPVLHMNVDPVVHTQLNIHPSPATNEPVIEDWIEDPEDNTIDQEICSQFIEEDIKSEVVEISSEDEESDSIQSIKVAINSDSEYSCVGDATQESYILKSNPSISSVNLQDICNKHVKIVSYRMDLSKLSFPNPATVTKHLNTTDLENTSQFNNLNYISVQMINPNICEENKQIVHTSSETQCSENSDSFKHIRSHTKEKSYRCLTCDRCFTRSSDLTIHIRAHTGEKPYECDTCRKGFSTIRSYTRHVRIHTGERPYECDTCRKGFLTNTELTRHIRRHTGETRYNCDTCGKGFYELSFLAQHILRHTGEEPYKCDTCGRGFLKKGSLLCHIRTHTGEKPYKCDTCGKGFSGKNVLAWHMKTHTGEKPHKCETCGKSFIRKIDLTLHIRTHTAEKPYNCETCGKGFIRKLDFSCHILTHTGEKPYKCDTCGKGFIRKTNLSSHIRRHTGEKLYTCDKCGKSFYRRYGLIYHIRTQCTV